MKIKSKRIYIFIILSLLLVLKNVYLNIPNDIILFDETGYLERGMNGEFSSDGFLYLLLYKLIGIFTYNNALVTYEIMFNILWIIILGGIIFTIRIKTLMSIHFYFLLIYFYFYPDNYRISPTITLLSTGIILFFSNIFYLRRIELNFMILAFLLMFVRPEYSLIFIFSVVLYFLFLFKNKTYSYFLPLILIFLYIFYKYNPYSEERSFLAFCQHYAYNKFLKNPIDISPWTQCEYYLIKDFGFSGSLFRSFWESPYHIIVHVIDNIKILVENKMFYFNAWNRYIFIVYMISSVFNVRRLKFRLNRKSLLYFILLIIPILLPVILVNPRQHYIVQFISIVFILYNSIDITYKNNTYIKLINYLCVLALITGYVSSDLAYFSYFQNNGKCKNIEIIKAIKQTKVSKYNIFSNIGNLCIYISNSNCNYFPDYSLNETSKDFFKNNEINTIILNKDALNHSALAQNESWLKYKDSKDYNSYFKPKEFDCDIFLLKIKR